MTKQERKAFLKVVTSLKRIGRFVAVPQDDSLDKAYRRIIEQRHEALQAADAVL